MAEDKIALTVAKIGLLGDSRVGKSSIIQSYAGLPFSENYLSTIGSDKYQTQFILENKKNIKLIIYDTAGQERFRSIALNAFKSMHGIVLVADLTNKDSFNNIEMWIKNIQENLHDPCLVLFGNKADFPKEKWEVTSEEAKKYAEDNKLVYFETSAKTKQGIIEEIAYIANQAYKKAEQKLKSGKSKNIVIKKDQITKPKSKCCLSKKNTDKNEEEE